jgi:hypothetical protein
MPVMQRKILGTYFIISRLGLYYGYPDFLDTVFFNFEDLEKEITHYDFSIHCRNFAGEFKQ